MEKLTDIEKNHALVLACKHWFKNSGLTRVQAIDFILNNCNIDNNDPFIHLAPIYNELEEKNKKYNIQSFIDCINQSEIKKFIWWNKKIEQKIKKQFNLKSDYEI